MTLRRILMLLSLLCAAIAVGIADDGAGDTERNLPEKQEEPEQEEDDEDEGESPTGTNTCQKCTCPCSGNDDGTAQDADNPNGGPCDATEEGGNMGSVRAAISLGATSRSYGQFNVGALVYAKEPSPALYTPDVLFVEMPYYFRHLSNGRQQDGVTPTGYVFGRQRGSKLVFEFAEGESVAKARPGASKNTMARLTLIGSDGQSPVSADPYFADLETGTGETWRFAVKTTESHVLGEFMSWKTSRGITLGKSALGLDVVYDDDCRVRQILTPSRLAVVETLDDGFSVTAYPVEDVPEFDDSTGLYVI
ncbi:MAG: hypothetical protein II863_15880, partial [Kiritimatiellae bacterium]|nr:hypothetical protein [Kiritimatiellia bacterium]